MKTAKDIISMLAFECYYRGIIHECMRTQNPPHFMKKAIAEKERLYHIRQSMNYIAICMVERGEY